MAGQKFFDFSAPLVDPKTGLLSRVWEPIVRALVVTIGAASTTKVWASVGGADPAFVSLSTLLGLPITGDATHIGFFGATPVVQQTRGATLTNSVTAGGSNDVIANYTSLAVYATDAVAIRNNLYQLARAVRMHDVALRAFGLET